MSKDANVALSMDEEDEDLPLEGGSEVEGFEWNDPILERSNADAALCNKELLHMGDGNRTPSKIVDWAAAHPDSELHRAFSVHRAWDDSFAARQYRKDMARRIVRAIRIRIIKDESPPEVRRVFVISPEGKGYEEAKKIRLHVLRSDSLRRQALRDLRKYMARYRDLLKGAPLAWSELDSAIEHLEALTYAGEGKS